ncbi:transmembrane protein 145-like [Anopheles darlingi]|uniref:transmembrane protein 145-like n=1 Tax=Anopheles darlingi TaxID=43151 RepID=UPI0021002684|nr:transmembrane protein 145-like [Anopheles darlingi]
MRRRKGFPLQLLLAPLLLLLFSGFSRRTSEAKYVEGHLKTSDNWAFLARFCFLSGKGKYEYLIEYEKKLGELKLLLYYDDKSQWPAIYKTDKTCTEKLAVLHPEDNQIVTLSPRTPYNVYSGCLLRTPTPKEQPNDPLPRNTPSPRQPTPSPAPDLRPLDDDAQYFDQFLKTTSTEPELFYFNENDTSDVPGRTTAVPYESFLADDESANTVAYRGDNGEVNLLENSTDYRLLVEQLFPETDPDPNPDQEDRQRRRLRRHAASLGKYESRLIVSCSNFGSFTSSRERWWYIAIANCDGSGRGLDVKYRFRMTNGPPGDFWHEHFSADEMYIPPILLAEAIAYSMLLLAVFICAVELKARHLYHCTYRLFTLSVLLQWFGVLLLSVTWSKYAVSGIGPFPNFGGIFTSASEITFLLLLLLMAKGYTITRARLKTCTTVKITIFVNLYVVVYVTLYIYQAEAFDPGEVLNLYESPAGFGLAGLRCVGWGFFLYSCAATIRKFTEKVPFYYPFTMLGSLWIMSGPVLTLLGVGVLDPWVRESAMHGALGAVAFAGHLTFLWLTWPSRANRSFPYHVRTNHVGVSLGEDDEATYPKHPYEPTNTTGYVLPLAAAPIIHPSLDSGLLYEQYLRERELYHSTSTPLSYVSFPHPSKPATNGHGHRNEVGETINSPTGDRHHLANGSNGSRGQPPPTAEQPRRTREGLSPPVGPDSGTPSLEVVAETLTPVRTPLNGSTTGVVASPSAAPPVETSSSVSNGTSPSPAATVSSVPEKRNPFLAATAGNVGTLQDQDQHKRPPNRIILPSLELPTAAGAGLLGTGDTHSGSGDHDSSPSGATVVPKHLFAAKAATTGGH